MTTTSTGSGTTTDQRSPGVAARITPLALLGGRHASRVLERNILVYRRSWIFIISGFFEPLFYLLSIGVGLSHLVGPINVDGREIPYTAFVAPGSAGVVGHERRHARFDLPRLLQAQDRQDLRRHALDAPGRDGRGAGRAQLVRPARRALLGRLPGHHGDPGLHRLAVGDPVLAGGRADQPGLRLRRHGRHDLHADVAGLRHGLARLHPPLPVLRHLLPADRVPRVAPGGRPVHPPLPGGGARACRRPGHLGLDPAGPHRLPGGNGGGRGHDHQTPPRARSSCRNAATPVDRYRKGRISRLPEDRTQ